MQRVQDDQVVDVSNLPHAAGSGYISHPTTLPSSLLLRRQVYSLTVKTQAVERARTIYTGHTGLPLFTLRYEQARRRQRRGEMVAEVDRERSEGFRVSQILKICDVL